MAGFLFGITEIGLQIEAAEVRVTALEAQKAGERLAVLESRIGDVKLQLNRIEEKIDRIGGAKP